MDGIISVVTVVIIVITIISRAKKANSDVSAAAKKKAAYNQSLAKAKSQIPPTPVFKEASVPKSMKADVSKPKVLKAEVNKTMLLEDRENDWLARQLRDEHRAFKSTSSMFDLKIEHVSNCDARYVKQYHQAHCDSNGIDTAKGK